MTDRIADQMCERLGDCVEDPFVEVGVLSADRQFHLAPTLACDVAHHAREATEELINGHHANLHDRTLQVVEDASLEGHGVGKFSAQGLFGEALGEFVQCLLQHRLTDNQLAHQVENVIDPSGLDAQQIFLRHGDGTGRQHRRSGRLRQRHFGCSVGIVRAGLARSFRRNRLRCRTGMQQYLDTHLFDDGRNLALGRNLLRGLYRGDYEFDEFCCCRRLGIGTNGNHGAHGADRVVNQLSSRDGHGTVRINFGDHVQNVLPGGLRLGHRQSFVLGPLGVCFARRLAHRSFSRRLFTF